MGNEGNDQILISLGREFGSGGHNVAKFMAQKLGINYYDRNILDHVFQDDPELAEKMKQYDERIPKWFLTRHVRGHTNSIEEHLANMQFDYIRKKAESGESFILVGRCGEMLFRDFPNHISLFVLGDWEIKLERVMDRCELNARDAETKILRHDRSRKQYHNTYSDHEWDEASTYDLCINSSKLGLEGTADVLVQYVNARREKMQ